MSKKPDVVNLECPDCKSFVPITCYKGDGGETYSLDEAPLILIAEINKESKAGRIGCMTCGMDIALVVKFIAMEKQLSVQKRFNISWRME